MAKRSKREKGEILSRTEKWEICKNDSTLVDAIVHVNHGLREYENSTIELQRSNYEDHKKVQEMAANGSLYVARFINEKNEIERYSFIDRDIADLFRRFLQLEKEGERRKKGELLKRLPIGGFLTETATYRLFQPVREKDAVESLFRSGIPANWVLESCFRKVADAYKSFFEASKRGDPDTRTIRPSEEWQFVAIQGALNKNSIKGDKLVLAPKIYPGVFEFKISKTYQAKMLMRSVRLAKFVISRDEPDLRKPGRFWISVTYEISRPEPVPFEREKVVCISLGSTIGIKSPKGEALIDLWSSDRHWKPLIDGVDDRISLCTKGSNKRKKRQKARQKMFSLMASQQKLDRREVVATDVIEHRVPLEKLPKAQRRFLRRHGSTTEENNLESVIFGHGVHFVLTDHVIRSKDGKLADASKPERSGSLGANWEAQNTAKIGFFSQWLTTKVEEYGGSVVKFKLPYEALPMDLPGGRENKLPIARALRAYFLSLPTS